jgi:hypothetical protein
VIITGGIKTNQLAFKIPSNFAVSERGSCPSLLSLIKMWLPIAGMIVARLYRVLWGLA